MLNNSQLCYFLFYFLNRVYLDQILTMHEEICWNGFADEGQGLEKEMWQPTVNLSDIRKSTSTLGVGVFTKEVIKY